MRLYSSTVSPASQCHRASPGTLVDLHLMRVEDCVFLKYVIDKACLKIRDIDGLTTSQIEGHGKPLQKVF
jgi:hypothetical protein